MRSVGSGLAKIDRDGRRADVYLSRPGNRNALNVDLMKDLTEAFRRLNADEDIWAITLLGEGPILSAGMDLEMMRTRAESANFDDEAFPTLLSSIERASQPVVVGIKGAAPSSAFELTLPCDFRVIGRDAEYGLLETGLGTFPHGGGTQRLPRLVGLSKAKEIVLTADYVDPEDALRIGLVHDVCDPDAVDDRARALADRLAENAPLALQHAKRALNAALETPLERGLDYERTLGLELDETRDFREGFDALREGREPEFTGE